MRWSILLGSILLLGYAIYSEFPSSKSKENLSSRKIIYWEKWTNFEGQAIAQVVDDFNRSEREKSNRSEGYRPIEVEIVTISRISDKILVALLGDDPPDLAGLVAADIAQLASRGALEDLSDWEKDKNRGQGHYLPAYYDLGRWGAKTWGFTTTPVSLGLHWNKRLFKEAGLDPNRPPVTISELDTLAEKLTLWEITDLDGNVSRQYGYAEEIPEDRKKLIQIGFSPSVPGWYNWAWGYWFNGQLVRTSSQSGLEDQENLEAYQWVQSYVDKIGVRALKDFKDSSGSFASPQNPFMCSRVAMELQGVWMAQFIEKYAPGMQWGVAPFPVADEINNQYGMSLVDADMIVIPKGARHREEALVFLEYLTSQKALEQLCMGHWKFSPLKKVSADFTKSHPHKAREIFRKGAESKFAFRPPAVASFKALRSEMIQACNRVLSGTPPEEALSDVSKWVHREIERDQYIEEQRK